MTNAPRRLSDPESVLSQIEEARKAFGDLASLVSELAGARGRLESLELQLVSLGETTTQLNETSAATLTAARDEVSRLGQRAAEELSELERERARHEERVKALLRESHQALDELMVASQDKIDGAVESSQGAVATVAAARTELTTAFERFRQEQLTKLDDVSTSHSLLSNRQRESEVAAQRSHDELVRRVDEGIAASRQEAEQLAERITGTAHSVDELEQALEATKNAQAEDLAAVRESHATELARLRRRVRLQGLLLALPSVGALLGVITLLLG